MIRAFGGQVSWDNTAAPGSTYQVDEASITHQICDRPRDTVDMKHSVSRDYVQPQWVRFRFGKKISNLNFSFTHQYLAY